LAAAILKGMDVLQGFIARNRALKRALDIHCSRYNPVIEIPKTKLHLAVLSAPKMKGK